MASTALLKSFEAVTTMSGLWKITAKPASNVAEEAEGLALKKPNGRYQVMAMRECQWKQVGDDCVDLSTAAGLILESVNS